MERVMEIVTPLCVHAIAALHTALYDTGIVQITFGYKYQFPPEFVPERLHFFTQLSEKVLRTVVYKRMNSVQPETIEVIVPEPHDSVVDEEPSYLITALVV